MERGLAGGVPKTREQQGQGTEEGKEVCVVESGE